MHIIAMKRLRDFWAGGHRDAEKPLRGWYRTAEKANWSSIDDVRRAYPHADLVRVESGRKVVVFNIGGNKYRLVADLRFAQNLGYVCRVMTHAEYSKNKWKKEL